MKTYPLYQVEWIDACSSDEWQDIDSLIHAASLIHSVGHLIHKDENIIVLTGSISDQSLCAQRMTIPRDRILQMQRLYIKDKK